MAVAHCARGVPSADTLVVIICLCVLAEVKQRGDKVGLAKDHTNEENETQFKMIRKLLTEKYQMSEDFFAMEERFKRERKRWVKLPRSFSGISNAV